MLSHSWTYNSLVNDVLSMKLNRKWLRGGVAVSKCRADGHAGVVIELTCGREQPYEGNSKEGI